MERYNSEGIPRDQLLQAFRDGRAVRTALKLDSCLLCRRKGVNDAGLCPYCWSLLDEEELRAGTRWLVGVGP